MTHLQISAGDLDRLTSVAVAELDNAGVLLRANAGFLRLLGAHSAACIGHPAGRFFIQPKLRPISETPASENGEVYRGLLTIGEYGGVMRTLRGRVWREGGHLCLLAEHDIEQLEQIGASMQDLTRESLQSQRALGAENVALKGRESQMVEESLTDALTGVGNRRKLDRALAIEIARAARDGGPLGALMADIDHFKTVNDVHGHAAGDKVLTRFGELLREKTRPTDIVARFGGEEFFVLMPGAAIAPTRDVAERIRMTLAAQLIDPLPEPVTSSFGVAVLAPGEGAEAFLARVDAALYRAKRTGRNKVVVAV